MTVPQIDIKEYRYFADNQWRHGDDNHFFEIHEPYSGKLFARVAAGSRADARLAVDAASRAFAGWSQTAPGEKARLNDSDERPSGRCHRQRGDLRTGCRG